MKPLSRRRARAMLRLHGPRSDIFRRRLAIGAGAVAIGLVALLFAVALGTLQLDPLALITGFIVGQLALVFKELIKTE